MINSKYFHCLSNVFEQVEGLIDFHQRDVDNYKDCLKDEPDNDYYKRELKNSESMVDAYNDILNDMRKVFSLKISK